MRSLEVHLIERPQGLPTPAHFALVETDVPDPADGQILVENIYMSVDPAMRPRLAGQQALNQAMMGGAIGRVLKSRHAAFNEGDTVESMQGFRQYFLAEPKMLTPLDPDGMPMVAYMSVLGLTGLTAYGGLLIIGALKEGENVFVSAAAGAVGANREAQGLLRDRQRRHRREVPLAQGGAGLGCRDQLQARRPARRAEGSGAQGHRCIFRKCRRRAFERRVAAHESLGADCGVRHDLGVQ